MSFPPFFRAPIGVALLCALAPFGLAAGTPTPSLSFTLVPRTRGAHAPHVRDADDTSTNWAGYAAESNLSDPTLQSVTMVTGTWTVPTVTGTTGKAAYSALWVGIDGLDDSQLQAALQGLSSQEKRQVLMAVQTVEQIGTEQDWTGDKADYYAWFEFYPEGSDEIRGFPVKPGDSITATVTYTGTNQFTVSLTNNTESATFSKIVTFQADRYSVEWIAEAPSESNGTLPLADFGTATFTACRATIAGSTEPISGLSNEAIAMAAQNVALATPSALSTAGTGFTVTWQASGATPASNRRSGSDQNGIF